MLALTLVLVLLGSAFSAQTSTDSEEIKVQLGEASSLYRLGRFGEAETIYQKVLRSSPDSQEALIGTGKCRILLGRSKEAIPPLIEALKWHPNDKEALRSLAHAFVELNQLLPGEQLLTKLIEADREDKESWYYLGVLMYQHGYYRAALGDLEKSCESSSDPARKLKTEIFRAVSLAKVGETEKAEAAMTSLLAQSAARVDPELLLSFAQLLYDTQRPEMALEKADEAVRASPNYAMAHFWRAKVLFRLGRMDDAATAAEQSVRLLPQLPFPRYLLVKIYQAQGRLEEAKREAEWLREYEDRKSAAPR